MTLSLLRKTELIVGNEEKHTVAVEVSAWTGRTKVYLDGKEIMNKLEFYSLGTKTENFALGDREKHELRLRISGAIFPTIELLLDGKLAGTG